MPYSLIRNWRLIFTFGAIVSIIGLTMFIHPFTAMRVVFIVSGVVLATIGIYEFFADFHNEMGNVAFGSLLCLMLGLACFIVPWLSLALLAYLIAAQSMVATLVQLTVAVEMRYDPIFRMILAGCAAFSFVIGLLLLLFPLITLQVLFSFTGLCLFLSGVMLMWVISRLGRLSNIQ